MVRNCAATGAAHAAAALPSASANGIELLRNLLAAEENYVPKRADATYDTWRSGLRCGLRQAISALQRGDSASRGEGPAQ